MATVKRAATTIDVLRLLAHLNPRLWPLVESRPPYVPPHPIVGGVPLNPQPLPPEQQDGLWNAVRDMSVSVAEATIAASLAGRRPAEVLREVGDDICPEPPKVPWPRRWPVPLQLQRELHIDAKHVSPAVQATAALVFQSYARQTTDKALSTAFTDLADRLLERALKTANGSA
ncbi:hypothetical protein QQM39_17830 [Streptomyces sp. DT2A-34]|uniref:hypothetical protein n=1 Tax=Streptomyces sp. DT2A-34 TaxID=3051182 RepID=UPI00265BD148|nr:hypothetical protein [Streptomyces sp. DT2A-34]MDO0912637.1 hypothetical protein [Streptomyces sp. DT2A-34]